MSLKERVGSGVTYHKEEARGARMKSGSYDKCVFDEGVYEGADIQLCHFLDCTFKFCDLRVENAYDTSFMGCTFKNCDIRGLEKQGARFSDCKFINCKS